jgi:methionyl-tRNA formyltransferase
MRVGFVTCVELGLECIEEVLQFGGTIDAIVTLPTDTAASKSGRVHVEDIAHAHGIACGQFRNVNDPDAVQWLRNQQLDWLFIVGWSQIAKEDVLAVPKQGAIGMHPTLLPQGRGRAAIPWTIIKGLSESGVTMFRLDSGVDSGPIVGQVRFSVDQESEDAASLYSKVLAAHRQLMREVWPHLMNDTLVATAQDESAATYWPGRKPEDGRLTSTMSASEAERLIRATTRPYPGAFVEMPSGERLTIWRAHSRRPGEALSGRLALSLSDGDLWIDECTSRPVA